MYLITLWYYLQLDVYEYTRILAPGVDIHVSDHISTTIIIVISIRAAQKCVYNIVIHE